MDMPEDVMAAAEQAFDRASRGTMSAQESIARAILADREQQAANRLDDGARAEARPTRDEIIAGEVELSNVLSGTDYIMPLDGMERVLTAAYGALPAPQGDDGLVGEIDRLRKALIETGRHIGAGLADTVSTDFLMLLPEEARLKMDAKASEIAGLRVASDGAAERCALLLSAKNHWMDRATAAEAEKEAWAKNALDNDDSRIAAEAKLASAMEALEPFAKQADTHAARIPDAMFIDDYEHPIDKPWQSAAGLTVGDLRRARTTLSSLKGSAE